MTNGIRANHSSEMVGFVSADSWCNHISPSSPNQFYNLKFYYPYGYTPPPEYSPPPMPQHIFHPPQSPPSQFHRTTHTPHFDETQHPLYQNLPQSFQPAQPQLLQPYTTTPTPATFVRQIPPTGSILQQPEMYAPQVFGESPERVLAASSFEIEAARQWSAFNIECWEKLYPGWKYDQYTGQWYQLNGYDATTSVEGSFDTTVRKKTTEVSYLQPISQSDEGTVAQNGTTESVTTWNQVPTSDNGYPFHMHFDPQYPSWYYDTIAQEWCSLDTYIPSTPPAVQSETPMWISDATRHQIVDKCKETMQTLETMNEILADTSRICKEISSKPVSQSPHMSTRISVIDDNDASIGNESKSEGITDEVGKELVDLKGSDSTLEDVEDDSGLLVLHSVSVLGGDVAFKENGDATDGGEGFRREEGSYNRSVQMEKMGKRLADMSKPVMENTNEEITQSNVLSSDLVKQSLSTCTHIQIVNNLDSLSKNEIMVSMNSEGWNQSQLTQPAKVAPKIFDDSPKRVQVVETHISSSILSPVVLCEKALQLHSPQVVNYDSIMVYTVRRLSDIIMWFPCGDIDDGMICHKLHEDERDKVLARSKESELDLKMLSKSVQLDVIIKCSCCNGKLYKYVYFDPMWCLFDKVAVAANRWEQTAAYKTTQCLHSDSWNCLMDDYMLYKQGDMDLTLWRKMQYTTNNDQTIRCVGLVEDAYLELLLALDNNRTLSLFRSTMKSASILTFAKHCYTSWLFECHWEFRCTNAYFYLPILTHNVMSLDDFECVPRLNNSTDINTKSAGVYRYFLPHSASRKYVHKQHFIQFGSSMPLVGNNGQMISHKRRVHLLANGSHWMELTEIYSWKYEDSVEFMRVYLALATSVHLHANNKELIKFLKTHVAVSNLYCISPLKASNKLSCINEGGCKESELCKRSFIDECYIRADLNLFKEGHNDNSDVAGDSKNAVRSLPFLEKLKTCYVVLFMVNSVCKFNVESLKEYDDKKLDTKDKLEKEEEEEKYIRELKKKSLSNLYKISKENFCYKNVKVVVSHENLDLSCYSVIGEYAYNKKGSWKLYVKRGRVWLHVFQVFILEDKDALKKERMSRMGQMLVGPELIIGPELEVGSRVYN